MTNGLNTNPAVGLSKYSRPGLEQAGKIKSDLRARPGWVCSAGRALPQGPSLGVTAACRKLLRPPGRGQIYKAVCCCSRTESAFPCS